MIRFLFLILSFCLILAAGEGTRVVKTLQVSGYGATKNSAIQNALIEAVKQKNGAYIQSVKGVFSSYSQNSLSVGDKNINATSINDKMVQQIKIATHGFIDNYQIDDIIKHDSDYEAVISVHTVEYRAPGNSANMRRKIVIVPSYTENLAFDILGRLKSDMSVSYNLTQEMTNSLTQTRKFAVLDRSNKSAYANETKFILSPNAGKDEILKLGQALGTDYLVVSTIKEFKITDKKVMIKSIGKTIDHIEAYARVNYQILTMSTRQIKWSNTIDFNFQPKGKNRQQIFYGVLKKISASLTKDVIDNIYPLRISQISTNGDAIIAQSTKLGTIYNVYALGDKLFDPYTKEFLGYDEVLTGKIKIVRSLAKVSYGEVIEGHIQRNSICRKAKNSSLRDDRKTEKSPQREFGKVNNNKKYIAIKPLVISSTISKYKDRYLKNANIVTKIKNLVSKSKKYRVLTRDKNQAEALMDENEFAKSDLSDNMNSSDMKFSNVDYQLLPKVTEFKLYTTSKKIEDIDAYSNRDYVKLELNIVVVNRKGEVIFESTKADTYSKSWSSERKLKRTRPTYASIDRLANKLVSSVLYDLLNKKAQVMNQKFITVVEVDKKSIYLDLGDNKNIQEGDIFPVYKEPKVKTIKRTGKTRLSYGDRIATVRINGIYDDGAEAVVIKGKISNIKEGYVLRVRKRR